MTKSFSTTSDPASAADEMAALIQAAQQNPQAFRQLYDQWVVPVYQYVFFRTRNVADAEDLTSQIFLAAYQALPRYRHDGHFAAWLFTIARNHTYAFFRKRWREVPMEAAGEAATHPDLLAEAIHQEEIERLQRLVQRLPEEAQELIRLRYVAELSFADIARVLGRSEGAVKKSLYRLQARLQSLLERNHE